MYSKWEMFRYDLRSMLAYLVVAGHGYSGRSPIASWSWWDIFSRTRHLKTSKKRPDSVNPSLTIGDALFLLSSAANRQNTERE